MSDYAVLYFDVRGRAEPIRLTLAAAGASFEDRPVALDRWAETKALLPLGQVPVLYEGDRAIPQSQAILRHLGRKHAMYGRDDEQALRCDILAETLGDLRSELRGVTAPGVRGRDPAALAHVFGTGLPPHLARLEKLHAAGPGAFFVNDRPTWADCLAFDSLDIVRAISPDALAPYPGLTAFVAAMEAFPPLASYRSRQRPSELAPLRRVLETGQPL